MIHSILQISLIKKNANLAFLVTVHYHIFRGPEEGETKEEFNQLLIF